MKKLIVLIVSICSFCFGVDYNDISFPNFLRELSHISGKNIVISGDIDTNFNVFFPTFDHSKKDDVYKLLKDILNVNELDYKISGDVLLIYKPLVSNSTINPVSIEEKDNIKIIKFRYLTYDDLNTALSIFPNIQYSILKDRVLVNAKESQIPIIENTINSIDNSYTLKYLSVIIFSTDNKKLRDVGFDFDFFKNFGDIYLKLITSTLTLQGNIDSSVNFISFLNLMSQKGYSSILYNPIIAILDGKDSIVESTTRVPITTGTITTQNAQTVTTSTTEYQNVGLRLNINEVVIIDNLITFSLELYIEGILDNTNTPRISSKHIKTHVLLDNQRSFLLAGINAYEKYQTINNIPLIENIPLLGTLTRHTKDELSDFTFSIFITVDDPQEDIHKNYNFFIPCDNKEIPCF